jgi:hypothetical protein
VGILSACRAKNYEPILNNTGVKLLPPAETLGYKSDNPYAYEVRKAKMLKATLLRTSTLNKF